MGLKLKWRPTEPWIHSCKGTIVSRESCKCTNEGLKDWLAEFRVVIVFRIKLKSEPLELLILTFRGQSLPNSVPVGFEWCRVRPYIPNPKRCFKCQKYGHIIKNCRSEERCSWCGQTGHTHTKDDPCKNQPKCTNCDQRHAAYDKTCPKWIIEKEVQRLKVVKNIDFPQARRLAEQMKGPITYSSVVSSTPHASPKEKVQLDPEFRYSKYQNNPQVENRELESSEHEKGDKRKSFSPTPSPSPKKCTPHKVTNIELLTQYILLKQIHK